MRCLCCQERPAVKWSLCESCGISSSLCGAFAEGRDRRAGYEPLAALQPMTDAVAEVMG